ncbi:MAG: exodeoxyribonuclease VII large subunit [Bacteroidota bacterium]|nr:exodeoxyribonuclease VII large subunit [Bacteroidota bacterium]MDP4231859.1 exodeoxyribonuclease VII large subunit [Bacteroidota bacterium]MDP4242745.1 exodeoxyribonuclease VII large subunit [Bacteroidota bacterium]MDP4287196.1 exodeoxyribonuclease VII large subunit [Bacteroidota bacterium]
MKTFRKSNLPNLRSIATLDDRASSEGASDVLSVGELTKGIRSLLETAFVDVMVEGEISNFLHHRSGHRYWTLKDSDAQISSVFWKSRQLSFEPEDGMKVICRGRLTVYPPRGQYQLDVFQMRPSGMGDLQLAYEVLRQRLEAEGLFDESRKRPIPRFPKTIGIVTSENGAALHDILTVLERRYPLVRVLLRPTAVQGIGAELEIARAIQEFNLVTNYSRPDVLIIGRGGGSLEDLWCFNEEAVVRAIYASNIPVISAVGHEVDYTIADYVADLRAPTPTAAAELATPDQAELRSIVNASDYAATLTMRRHLAVLRREIRDVLDTQDLISSALLRKRETIERTMSRIQRSVEHGLERTRLKLERDGARLTAMNPDRVLERGFTALESTDGEIISRLDSLLTRGEKNGILIFADGRITVRFD